MKRLSVTLALGLSIGLLSPVTGQAANFHDISSNYQFYHEVDYLSKKGIISGYADGSFKPNDVVTRGQASVIIGRALGLAGEKKITPFKDVSPDSFASGFIVSAVEKGIISGFTDNTYRPDQPVTRGQLAIFLDRAFQLPDGQRNPFTDISPSISAFQSILNVTENGIAGGYSDNTFRPNQPVIRGQFSAFLTRALKNPDITKKSPNEQTTVNPDQQDGPSSESNIEQTVEGVNYLSAADARAILTNSNHFIANGDKFTLNKENLATEFEKEMVQVTLSKYGVASIKFDTGLYLAIKNTKKENFHSHISPEEIELSYQRSIRTAEETEKTLRTAVDSVYGIGSEQGNQLYNKLIGKDDPAAIFIGSHTTYFQHSELDEGGTSRLNKTQSKDILSKSGQFIANGSVYSMDPKNVRVDVNLSQNKNSTLTFNSEVYYSLKKLKKEDYFDYLGAEKIEQEYQAAKKYMRELENALFTATSAIYGIGSEQANQLYQQIMEYGKYTTLITVYF